MSVVSGQKLCQVFFASPHNPFQFFPSERRIDAKWQAWRLGWEGETRCSWKGRGAGVGSPPGSARRNVAQLDLTASRRQS